jgi:GMP synthase (glutamine-hydrolysing)
MSLASHDCAMDKPVALVVHHARSRPGRVADVLARRGWRLKRCCAALGQSLPEPAEIAGAVVFGGPMSANDDATLPYLGAEMRWIERLLASGTPFFGVCLGAQLMARCLGARVAPHDEGMMEIGYWPIRPTNVGAPFVDGLEYVYHWHGEGFELPEGADLLATGDIFRHQAMRFGPRAYGVQFHPEVTREILSWWTTEASEHLARPGAQGYDQQLAGCDRHDAGLDRWVEHFVDLWLGGSERSDDAR